MTLRIEQLTVELPGAARPVLCDVSLSVAPGETVGLVGESGSGKSMTARSVLRLLPAGAEVSGSISVDGADVHAMPPAELARLRAERVGMVVQDPRAAVNPAHRVGDFVTEVLRARGGWSRARAREQAVQLLATVGVPEPGRRALQYPHELSGGLLQRAVIAGALAGEPQLLLADEPTTALDVTTQAEILALLKRLQRDRGLALLLITHDLDLAAAVCDRIAVMYAGRVVEHRSAPELRARPLHPYTAGLLGSAPSLSRVERLDVVPGRPLSLDEVAPGCPFQPRCPLADEGCTTWTPVRTELPDGHVMCRHQPAVREVS